jgi:transposase
MDVLYERCCGLDIHKRTVVACLVEPGPRGERPRKEVRTFETMTHELLLLADWLEAHGVTHVAMESTGVYWKPVHNLLEERFELLLVNAQHIKAVPGRKTDVRDCEWIADLLRHGLLRASFVPVRAQRELRELVRHRSSLVRERTAAANRLQKTLEGANIKLASVASDILGKSGRTMLEAIIGGESDPTVLAQHARRQLRNKIPALERALAGSIGSHQRFMLAEQLRHVDFLVAAIDRLGQEIATRLQSVEEVVERLQVIPGVGRRTAEVVVAEIGIDVQRFPTAAHLASWAALCPANRESAGKQGSGAMRHGNPWLRSALVEAAHAAARSKNTYLATQYRRLAGRRGPKKAAVAVAHSILVIVYQLLARQSAYVELGASYLDERDHRASERRLVHRLEALGYTVHLERSVA